MADSTPRVDPELLLAQTGWVRGLARKLLQDEHAADDVVQETWLAALRGAPSGSEGGLRAWLAVVARNLALKRRRREQSRERVERRAAPHESADAEEIGRVHTHQRLVEAVLELEEPYRSAIVLRYFEGLSPQAIARRKGLTPESARQRCSRGLRMLRARLEQDFGDEDGRGSSWCLALAGLAEFGGARSLPLLPVLGGTLVGFKVALGVTALAAVALLSLSFWPEEPLSVTSVVAPLDAGEVAESPEGAPTNAPPHAQDNPQTPQRPMTRTAAANAHVGSILGRVVDAGGVPVAEAWVRRDEAQDTEEAPDATTDAKGRFELRARIQDSPIALVVGGDGYAPTHAEARPGKDLEVVLLLLPRVTGRVVDEEGSPVVPPGEVRLSFAHEKSIHLELEADGTFFAEGLPVDTLEGARALVLGYPEARLDADRGLVPGESLELEIVAPAGVLVAGTVVDEETRRPVPGASVWADAHDFDPASLRPTATSNSQGHFELRGVNPRPQFLGDGQEIVVIHILAEASGYSPTRTRAFAAQRNEEGRYEFEVEMTPSGCSLRGTVMNRTGETPVRWAHVHGIDSLGNHLFLQTAGDGTFLFDDLPAGEFSLLARDGELDDSDGGSSVRAQIVLGVGVQENLELVLEAGEGVLTGTVTGPGGDPVVDVAVRAEYVFRHGGLAISMDSKTVRSDSDGRYRMDLLPPGRYNLSLEAEGLEAAPCFEPETHRVELAPGQKVGDLDVRTGSCVGFSGRVLLAGAGPSKLRVELYDGKGTDRLDAVEPDENGDFSIGPRLEGIYELRLTRNGQTLSRLTVGPDAEQNLLLAPD